MTIKQIRSYIKYAEEKATQGRVSGLLADIIRKPDKYQIDSALKPENKAYQSDVWEENLEHVSEVFTKDEWYENFNNIYELLGRPRSKQGEEKS